jgi:ElaB/YqjD/DUF883 family membrane-anchored ribosome-binding protein
MNESSETLRSDIDTTRRKMDETMDAIGDRLQGRHLVDEILGLFRRNGEPHAAGRKLANAAESAVHAVTDTVKRNPGPALLVGAGVAWFIYSVTRDRSDDEGDDFAVSGGTDYRDDLTRTETVPGDPDLYQDRPLEYPAGDLELGVDESHGSKFAEAKDAVREKASDLKERGREKLADVGNKARETFDQVRERARHLKDRARDRTQQVYTRSRERVSSTFHEHPLEIALGCLAAGLIAGLALPTPARLNRAAGPTVDRLRQRARQAGSELVDKTSRVARAAATAARDEAQAQGLAQAGGEPPAPVSTAGNLPGSNEPNPSGAATTP